MPFIIKDVRSRPGQRINPQRPTFPYTFVVTRNARSSLIPTTAALLVTACATTEITRPSTTPDPTDTAPSPLMSRVDAAPAETPNLGADAGVNSVATTTTPTPAPSAALTPPRVDVKNIGLHVGGGSNDAKSKAPFQKAIAQNFDAIAECYGQLTKGGTIGLDLHIPAEGGHPEVRDIRTALGGPEFRACVTDVFQLEIAFEPPARGATVISYSLRLTPRE